MSDTMTGPQTTCPIAASLELLGEKWTLLILRDVFQGIHRFSDLEESLGCPRSILSARLRKLVEHGVLQVEPYQEPGRRQRHAYTLSAKGRDLALVLAALQQWGLKYLPNVAPIAPDPVHVDCGSPVEARLACRRGHYVAADAIGSQE
ncbi:winged helix-turn-helix transcriptional regulator [Actinomyces sp. 432]|uniref:winged helix-turn-helix transcriptional regulator n=1 Tax=Actinomyces sp. 432 TaxID=2057798 RepID=UPI00192A67B5|nr:helix-turn-helix domain-containing protein [Actinomyces sp. 432]